MNRPSASTARKRRGVPGSKMSDELVDHEELLDILKEAVAARNGWKRILARCSKPKPGAKIVPNEEPGPRLAEAAEGERAGREAGRPRAEGGPLDVDVPARSDEVLPRVRIPTRAGTNMVEAALFGLQQAAPVLAAANPCTLRCAGNGRAFINSSGYLVEKCISAKSIS